MAYNINPKVMYKLVIVLVLILAAQIGLAQSITPEVVASSGDHYTAGNTQLSWTVGETIIDTYSTNGNILTQGFHQTELQITGIDELNPAKPQVNIYPNPASEYLIISVPKNENEITLELFDINGKLILSEQLTGIEQRLNVSALANANYVLRLQSEAVNYSSSHNVLKTQN